MKTSKNYTLSLLGLLEKPDLTALGKFLESPFFTSKKFLYPLFFELRTGGNRAIERQENTFARVFLNKSFDGHKWLNALSDLNTCIEDFLVVREVLQNQELRIQASVSALFVRGDEKIFRRSVEASLKTLPGNDVPETMEGWQLRFWILKRSFAYPLNNRMLPQQKLLDDMDESLEIYYTISRLQLACNRASRAQMLSTPQTPGPFKHLLEQTERLDQSGKSALVTLYRALLNLFTEPDSSFVSFIALLQSQAPRLEHEELGHVVRYSFNYCIRRYREGDVVAMEWYRKVFEWANERNILSEAATEESFFNNGQVLAKGPDENAFNTFIEKSGGKLPAERRSDAIALMQASRYFHHAAFDKAEKLLSGLKVRHARYALVFHALQVRINYEQLIREKSNPEDLELSINRFEDYLQRRDVYSLSFRKPYRTFIWFVRRMMQVGVKRNITKAYLLSNLSKKQPALKDWLAEKIDRLPG